MAQEPKKTSLVEFAGDVRRDVAWLTERQEWDEIVTGYQSGIGVDTIRRWLIRDCGYADKQLPACESIRRYLRNNHSR